MTDITDARPPSPWQRVKRRTYWQMVFPLRVAYERYRLRRQAGIQSPLRIVVGASGVHEPGWLPTDIHVLNMLETADWEEYFAPSSIDAILAEHVWEHLTPAQGLAGVQNCYKYLRSGGYLRLAVPDGLHPDPAYIESVRPGGSGLGADDHRVLYTHRSLTHLLEQAGFSVNLLEYFDDSGVFHSTDWRPADGMIHRSLRFDERNQDGRPNYTSLLADAFKR